MILPYFKQQERKTNMKKVTITISDVDYKIQIDKSGVGHCWVDADEYDCPSSTREEIAAEIIDGGKSTCDDYRATDGRHYRW